jgi:hypothetical protein
MTLRATVLPVVSSRASGSPVSESGDIGLPSISAVEPSVEAQIYGEGPEGSPTASVPVLRYFAILAAQAIFFLILLAVCIECQR